MIRAAEGHVLLAEADGGKRPEADRGARSRRRDLDRVQTALAMPELFEKKSL